MKRIILSYGIVSGVIVVITTIIGISLSRGDNSFEFSAWLGYLIMLVSLSLIFIAIKRFRDQEQGGVIAFGKAVQVGLAVAAVASVMYVTIWEIYLFITDYAFIHDYTESVIDAHRSGGASDADMTELMADMDKMKAQYSNPLFRLPMTFVEIFPVGLLVALISSAVLRKNEVFPANG